jgi:hypothetical protein
MSLEVLAEEVSTPPGPGAVRSALTGQERQRPGNAEDWPGGLWRVVEKDTRRACREKVRLGPMDGLAAGGPQFWTEPVQQEVKGDIRCIDTASASLP